MWEAFVDFIWNDPILICSAQKTVSQQKRQPWGSYYVAKGSGWLKLKEICAYFPYIILVKLEQSVTLSATTYINWQ